MFGSERYYISDACNGPSHGFATSLLFLALIYKTIAGAFNFGTLKFAGLQVRSNAQL